MKTAGAGWRGRASAEGRGNGDRLACCAKRSCNKAVLSFNRTTGPRTTACPETHLPGLAARAKQRQADPQRCGFALLPSCHFFPRHPKLLCLSPARGLPRSRICQFPRSRSGPWGQRTTLSCFPFPPLHRPCSLRAPSPISTDGIQTTKDPLQAGGRQM